MGAPLSEEGFYAALNDDLNTPVAIAEMHALAKALRSCDDAERGVLKARLLAAADLLGILQQDPEEWFQQSSDSEAISAGEIEAMIAERQRAKADRDFSRADELRDVLKSKGVVLEDSREGTSWRRE
jgi:cysteinyl-tRNA synthetase